MKILREIGIGVVAAAGIVAVLAVGIEIGAVAAVAVAGIVGTAGVETVPVAEMAFRAVAIVRAVEIVPAVLIVRRSRLAQMASHLAEAVIDCHPSEVEAKFLPIPRRLSESALVVLMKNPKAVAEVVEAAAEILQSFEQAAPR